MCWHKFAVRLDLNNEKPTVLAPFRGNRSAHIYTTFHAMVKPAKCSVNKIMIVHLCDRAFGKLPLSLLHLFALITFLAFLASALRQY